MRIGARLEAIGALVPEGCRLADIGTDHAYLPVWLLRRHQILAAVAGDIAAGPCRAAESTVARYFLQDCISVRQGAGLSVLESGEADCIVLAGMGASAIIAILSADMRIAQSAARLVLQPMRGAACLRRWLAENGWRLLEEELAEEGGHLYEILAAEPGRSQTFTAAEYEAGPLLVAAGHPLLEKHLRRKTAFYRSLLAQMAAGGRRETEVKYAAVQQLLEELEALSNERMRKGCHAPDGRPDTREDGCRLG